MKILRIWRFVATLITCFGPYAGPWGRHRLQCDQVPSLKALLANAGHECEERTLVATRCDQQRWKVCPEFEEHFEWLWRRKHSLCKGWQGVGRTSFKSNNYTSLVVQWLRIRPDSWTQVQSLVLEDSTCCGATKPVCYNYWSPCTCVQQQKKLLQWEACTPQWRVAPIPWN